MRSFFMRMPPHTGLLLVAVISVAATIGLERTRAEGEKPVAPVVVAKGLKIVNDAGKEVASLVAVDGGAGLWITGPDGRLISIYAINGQAAIGMYGKDKTKPLPIALTVDTAGEPVVQLRNKAGKVIHLDFNDLAVLNLEVAKPVQDGSPPGK